MKYAYRIGMLGLACLAALLAGCGGGGGGGATPVGSAKFTFSWPAAAMVGARSAAPTDANSLVVEIGGQRGVLKRPDTELVITGVPVGAQRYTMQTYSSTDGSGTPLSEAEGVIPITDGQTMEETVTGNSASAHNLLLGQVALATDYTVEIGKTLQMTVTAVDANGHVVLVALNGFSWQSSDPAIATVTNGLISGIAEGTATITATYGSLTVQGTVTVRDPNTPPTATFTATPASGDVTTTFQFNASGCSDAQDATSLLQVRWDWESDDTYDTAYGIQKTAQHLFSAPGTYTVRLQVKDRSGKTATFDKTITVKIKLSVTPATPTLNIGQQQTFTAQVQGTAQTGIYWAVQEVNGGTITSGGIYIAPQNPGTYHVIATSMADDSVSVSIPVIVQGTHGTVTVQ